MQRVHTPCDFCLVRGHFKRLPGQSAAAASSLTEMEHNSRACRCILCSCQALTAAALNPAWKEYCLLRCAGYRYRASWNDRPMVLPGSCQRTISGSSGCVQGMCLLQRSCQSTAWSSSRLSLWPSDTQGLLSPSLTAILVNVAEANATASRFADMSMSFEAVGAEQALAKFAEIWIICCVHNLSFMGKAFG